MTPEWVMFRSKGAISSVPEKNDPFPVTTTVLIAGSDEARASSARNWAMSCFDNALRFSGRLKASTSTPGAGVLTATSDSAIFVCWVLAFGRWAGTYDSPVVLLCLEDGLTLGGRAPACALVFK